MLKNSIFKTEIFCNNSNAFTVSFDQCNASLLNESINLLKNKKHLPTSNF